MSHGIARPGGTASASMKTKPSVFEAGALEFDFGTEERRKTFVEQFFDMAELMNPLTLLGGRKSAKPADPAQRAADPRQLVQLLKENPDAGKQLIWMISLERTPVYAIEPVGPNATAVRRRLVELLEAQVRAGEDGKTTAECIERLGLAGRLSGGKVTLLSGRTVPAVEVEQPEWLHGWNITPLKNAHPEGSAVRDLLDRVYYEVRNLGAVSADRAANFVLTRAFDVRGVFSIAMADKLKFDGISCERNPYSSADADVWDVKLRFIVTGNRDTVRVYRYTVDVSDVFPIDTGGVRSWDES